MGFFHIFTFIAGHIKIGAIVAVIEVVNKSSAIPLAIFPITFAVAGHIKNNNVLVVEDLLTTGGSVAKVCRQIEHLGGNVIGVSAVVNRGGVTAEDLGVPKLNALAEVSFEAVDHVDCLLCKEEVPIVEDVGHGDKFRRANPDYAGGYEKLL